MDIVFSNSKSKYIQLYEHISKLINEGYLKSDEKLPSKRALAINLNVSLKTIVNAYNLLLDEGYIYSLEKKGYFVCNQPHINPISISEEKTNSNIKKYRYDFTTQNIISFNNNSFKKILKEQLDNNTYINKTEYNGSLELRLAISKHLYENRGINVSCDQIVISSGMEIFEHVFKLIDIDNVTLENPGYHKLNNICRNINLDVNYISLDNEGVLVPKNKTILYTTPFNQFPTGIKMSISRKKELINFAINTDSYIIEDDFDAEFRINTAPTKSMFSLNPNRVIFFSTFSTTIFPGLRISYVILPNDLNKLYKEKYGNYSCMASSLIQEGLYRFINENYYASHINKIKRKYLNKRNIIIKYFKDKGIKVDENRNYLSLLINYNYNIDDNIIADLKNNGINIKRLSDYDINNNYSNILVLGYTAISDNDIIPALDLLIKIIEKK